VDLKSISEELYGEGDKVSGGCKIVEAEKIPGGRLLNLGLLPSNAKVSGFLEY